jgi:hypothetical protein
MFDIENFPEIKIQLIKKFGGKLENMLFLINEHFCGYFR